MEVDAPEQNLSMNEAARVALEVCQERESESARAYDRMILAALIVFAGTVRIGSTDIHSGRDRTPGASRAPTASSLLVTESASGPRRPPPLSGRRNGPLYVAGSLGDRVDG